MARKAVYSIVDYETEEIQHSAEYNEQGELVAEAYTETIQKPIREMVYRDMTEEELQAIPTPSAEEIEKQYTDMVQNWLDDFAKTKLYHNANSCISNRDSIIPHYKAEAERMSLIRDKWWDTSTSILADVKAGKREIPTEQELWQELNSVEKLEW